MKYIKSLALISMICGTLSVSAESWMQRLSDDLPVCRLSIPGTHDSGTGDGTTFDFFAKTQDIGIVNQFEVGIRAFDIRSAVDSDSLHIYHGSVATGISFDGVMKGLCQCLDDNPSEFVILIMRHESDRESDEEHLQWGPLMTAYLRSEWLSDRLVMFEPSLTVGDMRGKILVLSRDRYADTPTGGYIASWSHDADFTEQSNAVITGADSSVTSPLWVQDYYETVGEMDTKLSAMAELLRRSRAREATDSTWVINHASGYALSTTATADGYRANAAVTNPAMTGWLTAENIPAGCGGLIMMDFAGVDNSDNVNVGGMSLINAIIDSNFLKP